MNISSISQANNINKNLYTVKEQAASKQVSNNAVNNELMTNSLSEAIGRSQVSFAGKTRNSDSRLEHTSILGRKFAYEKEDGSFVYRQTSLFGKLKKEEQYFPKEHGKIVREVKKGIETVTATAPGYKLVTKTDKYGNELLRDESDDKGNRNISSLEFDRGRRVNKSYQNGYLSFVEVIDLKTNRPVLSGPLVMDEFKSEQGTLFTLKNIVTGQILREEKYELPNRENLLYSRVFSERTNQMIESKEYIPSKEVYHTYNWTEFGRKTAFKITSEDELRDRIFIYALDGRTIESQTDYTYDNHDNIIEEVRYFPGTEIKAQKIKYRKGEGNYTLFEYRGRTNSLQSEKVYKNNVLTVESNYYDDGKTKQHRTEYLKDGGRIETEFNRLENKTKEVEYNSRNKAIFTSIYDERTEKVIKEIEYDDYTGDTTERTFNRNTGLKETEVVKNYANEVTSERTYYKDGETKRTERIYHYNGTSTYTVYTEDGNIRTRVELDKDGNPINPTGSGRKKEKTVVSDEEIIKITLHKAAGGNRHTITDEEFEALAKVLGVDDANKLKYMEKETYRKLAFENHPDRAEESKKATAEKITQILNLLYDKKTTK